MTAQTYPTPNLRDRNAVRAIAAQIQADYLPHRLLVEIEAAIAWAVRREDEITPGAVARILLEPAAQERRAA